MLTVGNVASVIGVPVSVLAPRSGVQIEDSIDTMLGTNVDNAVKMLETRLLENTRVVIICNDNGSTPAST